MCIVAYHPVTVTRIWLKSLWGSKSADTSLVMLFNGQIHTLYTLKTVKSAQFSPLELPYRFPDISINTYFSLRTVAILHIATFTKYYVLFNFHGNDVVTL